MSTNWYTAYDADGEIVGTFISESENADANKPEGSTLLEGKHLNADGYVAEGAFVAYTATQAQAKLQRPPYAAKWSNASMSWVDQRDTAEVWVGVRQVRNQKLQASDWTDTASAPARLGTTAYNAWQTYRQALRDVTLQPDPRNITWPTPPQA